MAHTPGDAEEKVWVQAELFDGKAPPRRLTAEEDAAIACAYAAGRSSMTLAAEYGVGKRAIQAAVRRKGGVLRRPGTRGADTVDRRAVRNAGRNRRLVELYQGGATTYEAAAAVGCSQHEACRQLRMAGVRARTPREARLGRPIQRPLRCALDEEAFDRPGEERDYFVGFLMGDGCVHQPKYGRPVISLALQASDVAIIERFRDFLKASHQIRVERNTSGGSIASFRVSSRRMADRLASFGVLPRKTWTAEAVGMEHNRHFWRGMVDSDGCLSWRTLASGRRIPCLGLVGTRAIVSQFSAFVKSIRPDCKATVRPMGSIWVVNAAGTFARDVVRVLYEGAGVSLARKAALADEFMQWQPKRKSAWHVSLEELAAAREQHGSWAAAAKAMGTTYGNVKSKRRRLELMSA